MSRYLLRFALLLFLIVAAPPARAEFEFFEDFDAALGNLDGQSGWRSNQGTVVADPDDANNQVAGFLGGTGDRATYRPALITDGTTGTLFLRLRVATDNSETTTPVLNWSVGMSDVALAGEGAFGDFESQLNMNRDAGNTIPREMRLRDAGAFDPVTELDPAVWYKIWMVIDNAADVTEVFMQGGALATQTQLLGVADGQSAFVFRNSGGGTVANDLIRFFVRLTGTHAGSMYLDDLWLDPTGQNLADPSGNLTPPKIHNLSPTNAASFHRYTNGISFSATTADPGGIPADGITLTLNGADVTDGLVVSGAPEARQVAFADLELGQAYTAVITVSDASGRIRTVNLAFNTNPYPTFQPIFATPPGSIDLNTAGFMGTVHQARADATLVNTIERAEEQIRGLLLDPLTGQPFLNEAFGGPDFTWDFAVNFERDAADIAGNPDNFNSSEPVPGIYFHDQIPGIPGGFGAELNYANFASEYIAYLDLEAGSLLLGVNSDDGFRLTTSRDARDRLGALLGEFAGTRAAADTIVDVEVLQAGLYPVRLLHFQGAAGGASVEFFSVDRATGEKILINDPNNANSISAYRVYTGTPQPYVDRLTPLPNAIGVAADTGIEVELLNLGGGAVGMWLNGTEVTPDSSVAGQRTTLGYQPAALLPSGSVNTVALAYAGMTNSWQFTVAAYTNLPPSLGLPPSAADPNAVGFWANVVKAPESVGTLANTTQRAEDQLAGVLIDPATSQPYVNEVPPGPGPNGTYLVSGFVNWNLLLDQQGNFQSPNYADQPVPGIAQAATNFNVAAEVVAWLDLPQGLVKLGVNSDDGFRVTAATNAQPTAIELGIFEGGRGAADSLFSFVVPSAGLYPVRLLWYQGNGGGNVEFFSLDTDGNRILVNDAANPASLKAYYQVLSGAVPPTISDVSVAGGNITINWTGGGTLEYTLTLPATGSATWTSTGDSDGEFTEPAGEQQKYYRVNR